MSKNKEKNKMSKSAIYQSEIVVMKELNNLFIEMTAKNCNQRCKHCYIEFPQYKKIEDFIDINIVKKALEDTMGENIKCIYLTGAEPMTHPDFNAILRLCLKRSNVCICTNGSFINEKKARFLKKVQDETFNEIIFQISLDHYDEVKNDDVRYRGAFRHGIFALKQLYKYGFNPIVRVTNYYNENEDELMINFEKLFSKMGFETDRSHIKIIPSYVKSDNWSESTNLQLITTDCQNSRVLTTKGIYSCPFLSDDYRGRCGSSFENYSKKCALETDFCQTCMKAKKQIFGIDYGEFV